MREAGRDPKLLFIISAEYFGDPLSEGGGASADVNGDIENLTLGDANQFPLRIRMQLVMQAT